MAWRAPDLSSRTAVVTGATRGVGKGIALVLGGCGATVYVTGRSTRDRITEPVGTVEETADAVDERGGRGIPVVVDHTDAAQVDDLFARIGQETAGLDLLVANAWGGYESHDYRTFGAPFWEQPLERWDVMFSAGLRSHYVAVRAAAPLFLSRGCGLIVFTGGWDDPDRYLGNVPYDVVKTATSRLVAATAHELKAHGVTAVGVYPGFTRTEAVVAAFTAAGREPPEETHSPEFAGRAVAMLLADPAVGELSGTGAQTAAYGRRYDFTDVDGREIEPFVLPEPL